MTFKKDYINYLLHTVVNSNGSGFRDNYRLSKLVDTVVRMDDVMKVTFLVGKTAGLEGLFKYLLYISDKIDKSQVTIFNLKDNFDYDVRNLTKICENISTHKSENVQQAIENIEERMESAEERDAFTVNTDDNTDSRIVFEDVGEYAEEGDEGGDSGKLTLIENKESYEKETEVFELESITDSVENPDAIEQSGHAAATEDDQNSETEDEDSLIADEESEDKYTETETETDEEDEPETKVIELEDIDETSQEIADEDDTEESEETEIEYEDEIVTEDTLKEIAAANKKSSEKKNASEDKEPTESELDLEIEVRKPSGSAQEEEHVKEESVTNEAYYKFETRFFEEVKILEKLFASVGKDCMTDETGKLSEKCLQCFTEIIEITSELSSLSRQLSFDLIADIFLTMNLYTTKTISQPEILTGERIKLLDSSLALVNSLIKGEDYLNYDSVVDKIEKLKKDISGEKEEKYQSQVTYQAQQEENISQSEIEAETISETSAEELISETIETEQTEFEAVKKQVVTVIEKPPMQQSQMDSAIFKLKYLVKEFEKSFISIETLKGEYSKYDALEKIGELNNALRLIAKISAIIKMNDVLKLAEVTYVFLKYVKDYRMDLMEPEIKQIVKYIIFTFKMLLTNRKPEDFNVLVQHLNNPVKIFADS